MTDDEVTMDQLLASESELLGKARGHADVFVAAAGDFAADWVEHRVREAVTQDHKNTEILGDRLGDLKTELGQYKEIVRGEAIKALRDLPWEFRQDKEVAGEARSTYQSAYSRLALRGGKQAPQDVTERLRKPLGEAGRLLVKYGYAEGDRYRQSTGFRYPNYLDLSDDALQKLDAAAAADTEVLKVRQEIAKVEQRIGEERARRAFDEA